MDNRSSRTTIGAIERVPLRAVWPHEALAFTTWLQENVDVLNDVLDFPLSSAEREQAAGSFSARRHLREARRATPPASRNPARRS